MKKLILSVTMVLSINEIFGQWLPGTATPNSDIRRPGKVLIGPGPNLATDFQLKVTPQPTMAAANAQGWRKGIMLTDFSALYWDGGPNTNNDYFMGHSSSFPQGDFYQGFSVGTGPTAPVTYVSKVHVSNTPAYIPAGSTQIFKNLIVQEGTNNRRIGVNVTDPARSIESFTSNAPQLRLTQNPGPIGGPVNTGVYTDFQTTATGHQVIRPRFNGAARNVGIDVATPTQKIDVQGNARLRNVPTQPAQYIMTGIQEAGINDIRFSKLAFSGNPTQVLLGNGTWGTLPPSVAAANNGLSVSGTFVQLGQKCSDIGAPASLIGNREIPMASFNLYFTGQGIPTTNAIGLGYNPCVAMPAKFNTLQENATPVTVSTIGGSFINRDQLNTAGVITGLMAMSDKAQTTGGTSNVGGDFRSANAPINVGVSADAAGNAGSVQSIAGQFTSVSSNPGTNNGVITRVMGGSTNIGVVGSAVGGLNSYGVQASASVGSNNNYGVYTSANGGNNSFALHATNGGTAPNHWAGYFQGDVQITGNLWNNVTMIFSDKRLKKDIKPLENVNEKIKKLKGYSYNYRTEEFPERRFDNKSHIGLIAQELKEVFPELVNEDGKGFYAVDYQGMIPVLLEAIKDQQKETEELKALVKKIIDSNSSSGNSSEERKNVSVTLNDAQAIVLEQNVPNPFAEQTIIGYTLTEGVRKAQILFYNIDGKMINSTEIKPNAGAGQLNVFASDLSNGVYTYSLVVDGKIIETKRMVKSK